MAERSFLMYTKGNMILREIANIGKGVLEKITSIRNPNTGITKKTKDYSLCPSNCPLRDPDLKHGICPDSLYCREFCEKVSITTYTPIISVPSVIEGTFEHIPGKFTHSQIIQFIFIHFLPGTDSIKPCFSVSETARILNLCEKTVIRNIKKLTIEGLICTSKVSPDIYSIYMTEAEKYHLTKKEGGTGYIPVSLELFTEILNIQNVNSLKLEIRKLIKFDNNRINKNSTNKVTFSFEDIRRFLPNYINYCGIINKIVDGTSDVFRENTKNKKIEFELKEIYDARRLRKQKHLEYGINFAALAGENGFAGDSANLPTGDLIKMSFEYGHRTVLAALKKYIQEYYWNNVVVYNVGAFIRSLIQKAVKGKINLAY